MPVRRIPRFGAQKNIGKFASVKTGRVAWYESLLERDYMYLLDFDPEVTYWHEQPLKIRYVLDGKTHFYTPDLEVHRGAKKQLVEVKPQEKVESGKFDGLFAAATSVSKDEGYEFVIATDQFIRQQPRLDNIKKLWKYARTPVLPQHQLLSAECFRIKEVEEVELGDLLAFFKSKGQGAQVVYAMLFWGILNLDLTEPLNEFTSIKLTGFSATLIRKAS
ncbi:MAG: TnsA endonuclease N-terminal domain-containing protein [Pyrinomonadaceae bacterium]